jgi:transposase InsO family protein
VNKFKSATGAGLKILHIGHSSINTVDRPLVLRNILHVPEIAKHLLSVHKFCLDNKVFFEFHPWHFSIKDPISRKMLLDGRCEGGLYSLKPSDVADLKQALLSRLSPSRAQWHARLGHPSPQVVQSILRLNNIACPPQSDVQVCNACQLAKSHQLPYVSSSHRVLSPLELIHSDVWGPAPQSVGGFKYYISFIDDFSKFTWVYLMHDRSEASRLFRQFQTHVERLLGTKIKTVQSDWGGEYQKIHNTFFRSLGITHRVSCPHTHQQNGSAERKHRHIVETGLALLAHASMPIKFWDEAFLTATYLINRMPTRVIDNKCPLERLFKTSPNYSLLKIFGCACWPHLRPYTKHKLSFRSKECVFFGYSALHKGYKCLDVDSGRVYISRDVIFDEGVFPFSRSPPHSPSSMPASTPVFHFSAPQLGTNSTNTNYDQMQISLPANPLIAEISAPTISTSGIATSTDHLELMPLGSPCPP